MNLLLLEPDACDRTTGMARLSGRHAHHIRTVLKAVPGQRIRAGILNGPLGEAELLAIAADHVDIRFIPKGQTPSRPSVDLLLALPRPKIMKRLWSMLSIMGVGRILLTNAEKVERYYFDSHVLDPTFYRERLIEGLEQAGDTYMPAVSIHRRFKVLLEDELDALCPETRRLCADPAASTSIGHVCAQKVETRTLIAIGPEGGWTDYERDLLAHHRFTPVHAGPRILRTDTACIALLTILQQEPAH